MEAKVPSRDDDRDEPQGPLCRECWELPASGETTTYPTICHRCACAFGLQQPRKPDRTDELSRALELAQRAAADLLSELYHDAEYLDVIRSRLPELGRQIDGVMATWRQAGEDFLRSLEQRAA